ncbi:hypothetical protein ABPG75_008578 [Micractinium tetrahymenae]
MPRQSPSCLSAGASAELQRRVTPPALCWLESGGFRIEWGDLERVRVVGETSHGQVWQGRWQETDVAIKQLECLAEGAGLEERGEGGPLQRDASGGVHGCSGLYAALEREAKLLRGLLHPNIVLFLGVSLDPPAIVTEHCARGTLLALLNAARSSRQLAAALSWQRRLQMAMDAAKGMLHLHSHKPPILHRNLKSTKLLVDKDWRVKVLRGQASSTAADVYAFGLILWELLTWQPPFPGLSAFQIIHAVTERGERPAVPDAAAAAQLPGGSFACLHEYTALMQRCWAEEADQRPTFEQIIADLRRAESKLAMTLVCHPDVDKSPSAAARFADIKTAADVLLKGPQRPPPRPHPSAWYPAAAAAAARHGRGMAPSPTAGLWLGLTAAGVVAFAYGAWLTRSVVRQREREPDGERKRSLSPQRRQLLHALLADKQAQAARQAREQHGGGGAGAAAAAGSDGG